MSITVYRPRMTPEEEEAQYRQAIEMRFQEGGRQLQEVWAELERVRGALEELSTTVREALEELRPQRQERSSEEETEEVPQGGGQGNEIGEIGPEDYFKM